MDKKTIEKELKNLRASIKIHLKYYIDYYRKDFLKKLNGITNSVGEVRKLQSYKTKLGPDKLDLEKWQKNMRKDVKELNEEISSIEMTIYSCINEAKKCTIRKYDNNLFGRALENIVNKRLKTKNYENLIYNKISEIINLLRSINPDTREPLSDF